MNISLKSKRALVGGSSKGLGNAVANQLAMSGAQVTLVARNEGLLIENVKKLNQIKHPCLCSFLSGKNLYFFMRKALLK